MENGETFTKQCAEYRAELGPLLYQNQKRYHRAFIFKSLKICMMSFNRIVF